MKVYASKYQAYGNDFLVVTDDQVGRERARSLARSICDPHFGVGADGMVLLGIVPEGAYPLRIFNRDGSEAGMSGNGVRCAAACLRHRDIASADVTFATPSGTKVYRLVSGSFPVWTYRSEMGEPGFSAVSVPFTACAPDSPVRGVLLQVGEREVTVSALSVGNPQCVVFCGELPPDEDFLAVGGALSVHPAFPEGTNVSFVTVRDTHTLAIRIWERGVGPTFSSGTGCCGAAVAALAEGRVKSPVEVLTETGSQQVDWKPGGPIVLTGEVRFVADIEYEWDGVGQASAVCLPGGTEDRSEE